MLTNYEFQRIGLGISWTVWYNATMFRKKKYGQKETRFKTDKKMF